MLKQLKNLIMKVKVFCLLRLPHNNEIVKSAGGAIGLTENLSAFRKWMVSGT